jgi:hypothetical protein
VAFSSEDPARSDASPEPDDEHKVALVRGVLLGELAAEQVCEQEGLSEAELTEWIRQHRRAARRAIDERIVAVLTAHGLEKEDFVLSGNLESMALSDLLEAVQFGRKNAHIRIEHGGQHGELWCTDGEVIDAQAGTLSGTRAVYRLLSLRQGRLQAEFSTVQRERTVVAPTDALLVEFARRLDESKLLRQQIGDPSRVCVPNADAASAPVLEPEHADVLRAFDGQRSIAEVIEASERPELETLASIAYLLAERQLIAVSALAPLADAPPSGASPPLSADPASAWRTSDLSVPAVAASFVERRSVPLLARRFGPFAAAALALPIAFATGFWSVRSFSPESQRAAASRAPWIANLAPALCGPGMAFLPGSEVPREPAGGAGDSALRPFCLAQRPVSTQEYQECVSSQRCDRAEIDGAAGAAAEGPQAARCNAGQPGRQQYPINCVTVQQAEHYCEWRGQRLPLASEWEFAWRASRATSSAARAEAAGRSLVAGSVFGEVSEWTKGGVPRLHPSSDPSAEAPLYAVLEGSGSGARPSRLFMSASARSKTLGFRCASSLAATAALPATELAPQGTGGVKPER